MPDEAVIQILRAAVQSANSELHNAKTAAATTFGMPQDESRKKKTATGFASENIEPTTTKSPRHLSAQSRRMWVQTSCTSAGDGGNPMLFSGTKENRALANATIPRLKAEARKESTKASLCKIGGYSAFVVCLGLGCGAAFLGYVSIKRLRVRRRRSPRY